MQEPERWKRACAVFLLCAATATALPAQTFKTLVTFDLSTNGAQPNGPLVQGTDGSLYGTTAGAVGSGTYNFGTVFKITSSGSLTTLYIFCSQNLCTDGSNPLAGLDLATNGNFYGITNSGGANNIGSIFEITSKGTLTTLHSFCYGGACMDGYGGPSGPLVQDTSGSLYATTYYGGVYDHGTVFSITPSGAFTTRYSFGAHKGDGGYPASGVILANNGAFYGTTTEYQGTGTVFEVTPSGALHTLYGFCSKTRCPDGRHPTGLVQATDGNLYGMTSQGGNTSNCYLGCGTVFKITTKGAFTSVYDFCSASGCSDGSAPYGPLIQATDGNFYGTTGGGGANNEGTIFKITPNGTVTTLYNFCSQSGCADGYYPAGLVQDTDGTLYGTTYYGGNETCDEGQGCGTIFSLDIGLGPFVKTVPTVGSVGKSLFILGTNLTGATSVAFNGTPSAFKVVSSSLISTIVPTGATTGPVQVVTPSGTLTSNVNFQVLP